MPNFLSVSFLDTFELVGSLRSKMGLFKRRADDRLMVLPVRGPRANADDPDDDTAYVRYKDAAKWVELTGMLTRIVRIGEQSGGFELGRVSLELLPPGACLPWELEFSAYAARFARAVLPLRTNPGVTLYSGGEVWHPVIGWLTITNRLVRHSAINLGEHQAIWLALDFRKREAP